MHHRRLTAPLVDAPEVAVLLALRDGECFLPEQLASLQAQEGVRWRLLASDDGSSDATPAILRTFAEARPPRQVRLIEGPQQGPAANFLHLLRHAPISADYAAFADQDDVWLPGKLARAVAQLGGAEDSRPALYCGRTIIVAADLTRTGQSPLFARPPSFRNALTQCIGGGNTMVMNRPALILARAAAGEAGRVVMHDWWLYQLITGAGGRVVYDAEPQILYRQHGRNQIGANCSVAARMRRLRMLAQGMLRDWNEVNIAALTASAHRLTPENRAILTAFAKARRSPLPRRMAALRRLGLYRQTRGGEWSYIAAAAAGLI